MFIPKRQTTKINEFKEKTKRILEEALLLTKTGVRIIKDNIELQKSLQRSINKIYIMEHAKNYYILAKSREKNMYTERILDPKDLKKALKKVLYIVDSATIIAHDSGRTSLHLDLSLLKTTHKWYSKEIRESIPEGLEVSLERIPKEIKEDIIEIHHK